MFCYNSTSPHCSGHFFGIYFLGFLKIVLSSSSLSLSSCLYSAGGPVLCLFVYLLSYCIFLLLIFYLVLLYISYFFAETFKFFPCVNHVHSSLLKHFYDGHFQFQSDNSVIGVISVLLSVHSLVLFQLRFS